MNNLAILALDDFENWNNQKSLSMGGATGVIKSILPYLKFDKIYLLGITSNKNNLYKEFKFKNNIFIVPIIYVPKESKIPVRILAFYYSRTVNIILERFNIHSVYTHAEEISFWIKPEFTILYHMHGSANALVKAKNKLFRSKFFQYLWEGVRKKNIQKATKIIAIDSLCYDLIKKQNMKGKAILIPNFVDTNIFYKDDSNSNLLTDINENILLFVGRLEEVKGLELFVDTLVEINNREPGNWKGVFVGRGTYEYEIKNYISKKLVDDLFYFAGPVFKQDELRKIYNKASVLMIASYYEGIPMAILESLACGTPVISTNVGGINEFISDNKTCIVLTERDSSRFANSIIQILEKKEDFINDFKFSAAQASLTINSILNK